MCSKLQKYFDGEIQKVVAGMRMYVKYGKFKDNFKKKKFEWNNR